MGPNLKMHRQSIVILGMLVFLAMTSACMTAINIFTKDWYDVMFWAGIGSVEVIMALAFINVAYELGSTSKPSSGCGNNDAGIHSNTYEPPKIMLFS